MIIKSAIRVQWEARNDKKNKTKNFIKVDKCAQYTDFAISNLQEDLDRHTEFKIKTNSEDEIILNLDRSAYDYDTANKESYKTHFPTISVG